MKSISNRLTLAVAGTLFVTLLFAFIVLLLYSNDIFNKYLTYEIQIYNKKIKDTLNLLSDKLTATIIYAENMTRLSYEPTNILTEIKATSPYVEQIAILDENFIVSNLEPFNEHAVGNTYMIKEASAAVNRWPHFFFDNGKFYGLQPSTISIGANSRLIGYVVVTFSSELLFDDLAKWTNFPLGMCYKNELIKTTMPPSLFKKSNLCANSGSQYFENDFYITKDRFLNDDVSVSFALNGFFAKTVKGYYAIVLFISFVTLALLSFIIIRALTSKITRSISVLTKKVAEIKDDQDKLELPHVYGSYEVTTLANALNKMLRTIRGYRSDLEKQSKLAAIGQSTAMVAHDVRKPLASMKALLSSLPAIKNDPEQMKKMVAAVDHNITRTNTLLNDILEFSRDATVLNLSETDPQGIIVSALSDAFRNRKDAGAKISYDLKHSHVLLVDSNRIIRVLINIMDNAMDAMELNRDEKSVGLLQISTNEIEREGKRFIAISVADNGPGLSKEALAKVFDPFFTQGKAGGTGLGLAICHRIISMHGGKIEAANRTDGSGAVFTIELPVGEKEVLINETELIYSSNELKPFREEEAARVEYGDTANTSEFMRINKEKGRPSYLLIVDDEPLFRESIRCLLTELGQVKDHVKVVEVDSAEKALTLFQSQKFDYVIADIDLGKMRMNGYKFAGMVLDQYPNAHVLIHSNKRRDEMDKNIRQIGGEKFMGFLPKPMRASELLQFLACKTFEVTAKGRHPDSSESGRKDLHILLVNDDEALRIALKWQIKSAGNTQVVEASGVSDALSKIVGNNIDIILSDINLGDGEPSGYDLLKKFREQGSSNAKFYMVSGYSRQSEEPNALSLGADGYCQLPLEDEHLKEILNS